MKKLLSLVMFAGLLSVITFGTSLAAGADAATATGSIVVNNTIPVPPTNINNVEIRLAGQDYFTKQGLDLSTMELNTNTPLIYYTIEVRNTRETTDPTAIPASYRLDTIEYTQDNANFLPEDLAVVVSTNPDFDQQQDYIYNGNLQNLYTSVFDVYPTYVDADGQIINQPITTLYLKLKSSDQNQKSSVKVNFKLAIYQDYIVYN